MTSTIAVPPTVKPPPLKPPTLKPSVLDPPVSKPPISITSLTEAQGWLADRSFEKQFGLDTTQPRVAVLIPCRNEEASIGKVVSDFQTALPEATIYIYDNNSTDRTMLEARAAGAIAFA